MAETKTSTESIAAVARTVKLLKFFGEQEAAYLGIVEVGKHLGVHKTVAYRMLRTLEREGWITQNRDTGKYKLGLGILSAAAAVVRDFDGHDQIVDAMRELCEQCNEDVVWGMLVGGSGMCVELVKADNALSLNYQAGMTYPLSEGATGKTLFAYQSDDFILDRADALFDNLPEGQHNKAMLFEELVAIRQAGHCITVSPYDVGVVSMTVPLFAVDGHLLGTLGFVGAECRMRAKGFDVLLAALKKAAGALTAQFVAVEKLIHT